MNKTSCTLRLRVAIEQLLLSSGIIQIVTTHWSVVIVLSDRDPSATHAGSPRFAKPAGIRSMRPFAGAMPIMPAT